MASSWTAGFIVTGRKPEENMRLAKATEFIGPEIEGVIQSEIRRQSNISAITAKGIARPVEERLRRKGRVVSPVAVEDGAARILRCRRRG